MSLTDHLHSKSDPIRNFLDARLVDFGPARESWHAAQAGGVLVEAERSESWHLIGWAIDYRIRMMFAPMRVQDSNAWKLYTHLNDNFGTTLPSVASELAAIQKRHGNTIGELTPDEETHLLQVIYVLAMYEALARTFGVRWTDSPLRSLKKGAKWQAHLNRVPDEDIEVLQTLVKPAAELFPLVANRQVVIGPVFADSHLVGGADGDLIISGNLIEIKCEAPGFSGKAVRQVIAYSLLDTTNEYELKKCSIYLARFGGFASWNLNEIIREISHGRYGYESLRQEFHGLLVGREMERQAKLDVRAESQRRFSVQWQAVSDASDAYVKSLGFDFDASLLALAKLGREKTELRRLESETGLDSYWD